MPTNPPTVLVLGGSQGAHAINLAVIEAVPKVTARVADIQWVHQTGLRDVDVVRDAYARAGIVVRTAWFLDRVADEMSRATLIVCRAGATTLAELAAIGRAAVLIPFAAATDDHQRRNARVLADAGAAEVIDERELGGDRLSGTIERLLADPARLATMHRAMHGFARPDAAAQVVDRLLALAAS